MVRVPDEIYRFGANPEKKKRRIRSRDDYTCQRCDHKSGPHAGDDGRVLQVHHIRRKSEGGSNEDDNLITLCRPCHTVQHPKNDDFDAVRGYASCYPTSGADGRVAFVNSRRERESLESFLDRKDGSSCRRCGNPPADGDPMYVYPNVDFEEKSDYDHPAEKFDRVCEPCLGLVSENHDADVGRVLYTVDGERAAGRLEWARERTTQALVSGARKTRQFDATRDEVNTKEWFLFKSPYRILHWFWRTLGTAILAVLLFLFASEYIGRLTESFRAESGVAVGQDVAGYYVGAGIAIGAVVAALLVRWTVAIVTDQAWHAVDDRIQPHHFRKAKLFTLKERLSVVGVALVLPYLAVFALLYLLF
jgi:hypothetical protein